MTWFVTELRMEEREPTFGIKSSGARRRARGRRTRTQFLPLTQGWCSSHPHPDPIADRCEGRGED